MRLSEFRLEVLTGPGVIVRYGESVLVVLEEPNAPAVKELVELVVRVSHQAPPGKELARQLAVMLTTVETTMPAFCALAESDRGLVVFVHGAAQLHAVGPENEEVFSGENRPTWVDAYLDWDVERIEVTSTSARKGISDPFSDLVAGIVPGAGAILTPRSEPLVAEPSSDVVAVDSREVKEAKPKVTPPKPELAREETTTDYIAPASFETVDFSEALVLESFDPLPIAGEPTSEVAASLDDADLVEGIRCIRGHFNHPRSLFCAHCGISMVQQTHGPVKDRRPPVGILVFDDGMTFTVDTSYVIGRDPGGDELVMNSSARPLTIADSGKVLSRVHAEIRLEGWDPLIIDRGSANGTYLDIGGDEHELEPGVAEPLESGARVRLGDCSFVFESHHLASHR